MENYIMKDFTIIKVEVTIREDGEGEEKTVEIDKDNPEYYEAIKKLLEDSFTKIKRGVPSTSFYK